MPRQLLVRLKEPDEMGEWVDIKEEKYELWSTDDKPVIRNGYTSKTIALKDAGIDFLKPSQEQVLTLWAPAVVISAPSAAEKQKKRRQQAVARYVEMVLGKTGKYFARKVILCTKEGDLPLADQPSYSIAVFEEGNPAPIEMVQSESWASAVAAWHERSSINPSLAPKPNLPSSKKRKIK